MAETAYQVKTIFTIIDKASTRLEQISGSGSRMNKILGHQMAAAEMRFQSFGMTMQKVAVGAFGALAASAGAAIKSAIPLGMELEQNLGGTEAVFGKFANNIQKKAQDSYKTMGLSASDYMATANKMGSLFQGSGIAQEQAMDITTRAMQRAADVASVMGIDTKMAMESIAGAAKGNFTMMDNLGVAMNATTLEAYALQKGLNFKWKTADNAKKAELAMQMFFERTQQYAGNFAKEADTTLSGSFNRMKTSMTDILANMTLGRSIEVPLKNMQESVLAFAKNIVPAVVNIINQLPSLIKGVMAEVSPIIEQSLGQIHSPFGEILVAGLKVIQMIWALRKVIIAVGVAAFAWRILMDGIYGVTKALQLCNAIAKFSKGIMLAHQAAIHGTTIAIKAKTSADLAAAAGMKVYAVGAKIATAAQWLFNAAMAANPVGLVIAGIVLLVGIILVLTNKWKAVTDAVDGFFAKIRNMTGVGGAILKFLVTPFETAWRMIRSVFDIFAAFKAGGFLNGLKMIGLAILQWLVAPLQGMLQALSFLPGIGTLSEKMNNWFDTTRQNLLNGGGLPKTEEDEAAVAGAAPTASAAAANSYSREESVTTSRVEVGLADGLEVKNGSAAAPNFTLNTGGR